MKVDNKWLTISVASCALLAAVAGCRGAWAADAGAVPPAADTHAVELRPQTVAAVKAQFVDGATPGQEVFNRRCVACHGDAPFMAGTIALGARYGAAEPAPLEQRTDLIPEQIAYFVRHGISVMPGFRKTEISDQELAQLSEYLVKQKPAP